MKKLTIPFVAILSLFLITSCGESGSESTTDTTTQPAEKKEEAPAEKKEAKPAPAIIDITTIQSKTPAEVEAVLGKPASTDKVKGFPCKNANCDKSVYKDGAYEIIFREGKADRITINNIPNFTDSEKGIEALGLPASKPAFQNAGTTAKWNDVNGASEISFFTDYVLVQVSKLE